MEWLEELFTRVTAPIVAWFASRRYSLLLEASPAILVGVVLCVAIADQRGGARVRNIARYHSAFSQALDSGDLQAAEVHAQKLGQLDPKGFDARFGAAWLAERNGDLPRAMQLMRELAPVNESGHPRAHRWLADRLLTGLPNLSPEEADELIHHLECSLQADRARQESLETLAKLCLARKDYVRAVRYLEDASTRRPELRLVLAETYRQQGQLQKFRDEVDGACKAFRRELEGRPHDREIIVRLVKALALGEQFDPALQLLKPELGKSDAQDLQRLYVSLLVGKYDKLADAADVSLGQKLEILQQALEFVPLDPAVLTRLAAFSTRHGGDATRAREMLKDALSRGEVPASVHLLLGTAAAEAQNWEEAKLHLELAQRLEPKTAAILNNLAWVVAHADPPDLDRALSLASAALSSSPNHPEILATRGRVLLLLKRHRDALVDLELALSRISGRATLHSDLAQLYEALGDPQLAERHRRLAEKATADATQR